MADSIKDRWRQDLKTAMKRGRCDRPGRHSVYAGGTQERGNRQALAANEPRRWMSSRPRPNAGPTRSSNFARRGREPIWSTREPAQLNVLQAVPADGD